MGGITAGHSKDKTGTYDISYCANFGTLNSVYTSDNNIWAGGIIGRDRFGAESVVSNCYNAIDKIVTVNGNSGNWTGGIAGVPGNGKYSNNATTEFEYVSDKDQTNSASFIFGYGRGGGTYTDNVVVTDSTDLDALLTALNSGLETPAFKLVDGKITPAFIETVNA